MVKFKISILFVAFLATLVDCQTYQLPESLEACQNRTIHFSLFGKFYHFSWLEVGMNTTFDWDEARNYCRRFCMDAISFESFEEVIEFNSIIENDNVPFIWTGGRKCNFEGCDRPDLQPAIVNGWFWAPTETSIPPKGSCDFCLWSTTGGLLKPQPDNREFLESDGDHDEACIGVLNNFYQDGTAWHDIACYHKKNVICQDSQALLDYIGA